jgi:hypothetical protein
VREVLLADLGPPRYVAGKPWFEEDRVKSIARFCGNCSCGCPELFVDLSAPAERQVVITDDFGQRVEMSLDQFGSIVEAAKSGTLDDLALVH